MVEMDNWWLSCSAIWEREKQKDKQGKKRKAQNIWGPFL